MSDINVNTKAIINQFKTFSNLYLEKVKIIEESDKYPEVYLENKFFSSNLEMEFIFDMMLNNYGEDSVYSFKLDFFQKVSTVLKSFLPSDDMIIEFDNTNGIDCLLISIEHMSESIPLCYIYPQFKEYLILPYYKIEELQNLLIDKQNELEDIESQIDIIKQSYVNPALYCGENVKLFTQMTVNKKKRELILNNALTETNALYRQCKDELIDINDEIQSVENMLLSLYILRDRYLLNLESRYQFNEIKEHTEETEEIIVNYDEEEISTITVNYDENNEVEDMSEEDLNEFEEIEFDTDDNTNNFVSEPDEDEENQKNNNKDFFSKFMDEE